MSQTNSLLAWKLEYVWLDAAGKLRSKVRVTTGPSPTEWNYDGSSTGQRETASSEVKLYPVKTAKSPFGENERLVLCDSVQRNKYASLFAAADKYKPMFGLEQEFFVMETATGRPLGWGNQGRPATFQGPFYCSVGQYSYGRKLLDDAVNNCMRAELNVTGYNMEVAPGQQEIQLCASGIDACDQFYLMRYILERTAESHGCWINYSPKPYSEWNGSGCHINFSTKQMREASTNEKFKSIIAPMLSNLAESHRADLEFYGGSDNRARLTGTHETSSFEKFSFGEADRTASVRLPVDPVGEGRVYFEDRRPAANIDPYCATAVLLRACPPETPVIF